MICGSCGAESRSGRKFCAECGTPLGAGAPSLVVAQAHEHGFEAAERRFAEIPMPFDRAVGQLEHAEWLMTRGRVDEAGALLADASETFERLQARPWLERVAQARSSVAPVS